MVPSAWLAAFRHTLWQRKNARFRASSRSCRAAMSGRRSKVRPQLEGLEDRLAPAWFISAFAGGGSTVPTTTPMTATNAQLSTPSGVAVDSSGNIYIADNTNHVVEKVDTSGQIKVIAGGSATTTQLTFPYGVAVDGNGNVYIADSGSNLVYKLDTGGQLTIFAGGGMTLPSTTPTTATDVQLGGPHGLAVDGSGNVYIADQGNNVIEKVDSGGHLVVIAGGDATTAQLLIPYGVAIDGNGKIYIADSGNNVIERLDSGQLTVIAGGAATTAQLSFPTGVAVDGSGNVYIADFGNNLIEKLDTGGQLTVLAGGGTTTPTPTPILATNAQLSGPYDVIVDSNGKIYIADSNNNLIESLTFNSALSVASQPANAAIDNGQSDTLTVAAIGGTPGYTYQWYTGTSGDTSHSISGATSDTLLVTPTSTTSYWVRITDSVHATVDSTTATVTVNPALGITTQPTDGTVNNGQSTTLSVVVNGGTTPYSYQWYIGSSGDLSHPISGATNSTYQTPALSTTTNFWVQITDAAHATLNSNTATITVNGGIVSTLTVTVFRDFTANGVQEPGELGLAGMTVYLDLNNNGQRDTGEPTQVTDASGIVTFTGLAAGTYQVHQDLAGTPGVALTHGAEAGLSVFVSGPTTAALGDLLYSPAAPVAPTTLIYGSTNPDTATAYIQGLYHSLLGRAGEIGGLTYWVGLLNGGVSRQLIVQGFLQSQEHRGQEVDVYYQTFLHRSADAAGRTYWINQFLGGADEATVLQGFLTSAEFQAAHPDDTSFVQDLYLDLLGRTPDTTGQSYWLSLRGSGTSRASVVAGIVRSAEVAARAVDGFYAAYLHRAADPAASYWLSLWTGGVVRLTDIAAGYLTSDEFFNNGAQTVS